MVTVRCVVSLATQFDWPLYQMDFYNAFLQGFTQSKLDYSLFTKGKGANLVIILVYADDLLITGNDTKLIEEAKNILNSKFKMKDLGELKYFLGIEFAKPSKGIFMNQIKYALELISECGLGGAKPLETPLEQNQKFATPAYDKFFEPDKGISPELDDRRPYQRLLERLLYLAITRPTISFAVQTLSQYMHSPTEMHCKDALRVVRYIKYQPGLELLMSRRKSGRITIFCDADWASCVVSRKSATWMEGGMVVEEQEVRGGVKWGWDGEVGCHVASTSEKCQSTWDVVTMVDGPNGRG
ncbi:uncharacterized mitochondrial protein AtMg00810-like [Nicotiana sylvestris]|uniref:uncharacterized mitochondrial protein AtMg00810-like n=1 Tax=Nicotiana sylvestris TaxID=4096 RepID=UPI00388C39DA